MAKKLTIEDHMRRHDKNYDKPKMIDVHLKTLDHEYFEGNLSELIMKLTKLNTDMMMEYPDAQFYIRGNRDFYNENEVYFDLRIRRIETEKEVTLNIKLFREIIEGNLIAKEKSKENERKIYEKLKQKYEKK